MSVVKESHQESRPSKAPAPRSKQARLEREAEQLRANLRKRKEQARARLKDEEKSG